jgi:hypothetical protein
MKAAAGSLGLFQQMISRRLKTVLEDKLLMVQESALMEAS